MRENMDICLPGPGRPVCRYRGWLRSVACAPYPRLAAQRFSPFISAACLALVAFPVHVLAAQKPLALDPSEPISHYVHQKWDDEAGLPPATGRALAQTSDGYLWIGAETALIRFDGRTFRTFTRTNTPGLAGHHVETLLAARNGSLLIGTQGAGLSILENRRFRTLRTADGLASDEVTALLEARDGTFWIGTASGLQTWDGNTTFRTVEGFSELGVSALAEDGLGAVWIGTPTGIARLADGRVQAFTAEDGAPATAVGKIAVDGDVIWIGTKGSGLFRYESGRFRSFTMADGLADDYILALAVGNGALWIGTNGGGVSRLADGVFSNFDSDSGLLGDHVWSVLEDRDGTVWVGTVEGLNQFKAPSVRTLDKSDGLSHYIILPILQSRSGDVWIGTAGGGVNRYSEGKFEHFATADGLSSDVILSLAEDRDGSILIGSTGGLDRFRDGRIRTEQIRGVAGIVPLALYVDSSGSLWIGTTDSGAYRLSEGQLDHFTTREGLAGNRIYDFLEDRKGRFWIATGEGGLSRFENGRFTNLTTRDGLRTNGIASITEGSDGSIWLPTSGGGVVRLVDEKLLTYSTENGLLDDLVHRVLEDENGGLWLSSNIGISFISRQALEEFDAGRTTLLSPRLFDRDDGMKNRECNGGVDPSGWKMQDGSLWFPTMGGVVIVEPQKIARQTILPAPVVIEQVLINGEPADLRAPISYVAGRYNLEISYTSPTLSAPNEVIYLYKLDGFDPEWIRAGDRTVAYYTQLPPGEYTFRVIARTADGASGVAGDPILVTVRPRFYQRPLFYLLIAALLAAIAYAIYRARIRTLQGREHKLLALMEERARGEEALRLSEQHFRSLIENASDMILTLSVDGRIVYASPSVETILGYSPDDMRGRMLTDFMPEEDRSATMDSLIAALDSDGAPVSVSFHVRHANGTCRSLEAKARELSEPGSREAVIVNCRDTSERQLLQNQLEQANRLSSLGRLAATVAHEFNNVLMGIQPFAEVLERKAPEDPLVRSASTQIAGAVKRGKRITDEILRYARPHEPQLADVNIAKWIGSLEPELRGLVGDNVEIRTVLDDSLVIRGDRDQLNQVITNLVLNARDAMPDGGTITIEAAAPHPEQWFSFGVVPATGGYAHLIVRDTGTGMPEDVRRNIFEPLFTTKRAGGTGLGLTVAHQIIERHSGEIFVESTPGKGSAFHLFLPRQPSGEATPSVEATPARAPVAERKENARHMRVLLVEDDDTVRSGLETLLEGEGMEVAGVSTGGEALGAIERFSPDAVVLDVGLPDVDGVELYESIAQRWPELPVIFSTGHGDQSKLESYLSSPHVGFLLKPYELDTLLRELRKRT